MSEDTTKKYNFKATLHFENYAAWAHFLSGFLDGGGAQTMDCRADGWSMDGAWVNIIRDYGDEDE